MSVSGTPDEELLYYPVDAGRHLEATCLARRMPDRLTVVIPPARTWAPRGLTWEFSFSRSALAEQALPEATCWETGLIA